MPTNIIRFERLAYFSLALFWMSSWLDTDLSAAASVALCIVVGAPSMLLIWLTARRRKNWGRWTLSILSVASIAVDVTGFFSWVPTDRAEIVLIGSDIVLAAALYCLWAGNSGGWFQRPGAGTVAEQSTVQGC